jgi:hypothetical protein
MDSVFDKVLKMVEKYRKSKKNLELECRIGQFTTQHQFVPGYEYQHLKVITKMISSLHKKVACCSNWSSIERYKFCRCQFAHDIRSTHIEGKKAIYVKKKGIDKINIKTDNREYDVRFALASEEVVELKQNKDVYNMISKSEPDNVRLGKRLSFFEEVNTNNDDKKPNDFEFKLRYDITQFTKPARNKIEACGEPTDYHCEIEMDNQLLPLENKEIENKQNRYIAKVLLSRIGSLLGTSVITPSGHESLDHPKFYLLQK